MRIILATILLVYCIWLLPPLCFCVNCPLERVELDLSHPPPHPYPSPSITAGHPSSLWRGGVVAHPPDSNPPPLPQPIPLTLILPPPQTLMVSWESMDDYEAYSDSAISAVGEYAE